MKVKADLHNHLRTSSVMNGFNKAIDISRKKLGCGGILGVINFNDSRYEDFVSLNGYEREDLCNSTYIPEKDILVMKGQEVPTKDGHLLVLGLQKDVHIKKGRSLEDTIKESKDNNCITIADHPFYIFGSGNYLIKNKKLLEEIDALEIYNGEANFSVPGFIPFGANKKIGEFYEKIRGGYPNLGSIVTSDGHSLYEIGSSWMEIPRLDLKNSESIVESLRAGLRVKRIPSEEKKSFLISYLGAIDHAFKLVTSMPLNKIGR